MLFLRNMRFRWQRQLRRWRGEPEPPLRIQEITREAVAQFRQHNAFLDLIGSTDAVKGKQAGPGEQASADRARP